MRVMFICVAVLAPVHGLTAQTGSAARLKPADVIWTAAGGLVAAVPALVEGDRPASACAPCDPARVAWFDRWSIAPPVGSWSDASTLLVGAAALGSWWELSGDLTQGDWDRVTASVQSVFWSYGVVQVLKTVVARERPVLYTDQALDAARSDGSRHSWPSGHTAAAFSLATSHWLATRGTGRPAWHSWALFGAAGAVGTLRVVAHQHFPSDVLAGAVLGTLSALVVHEIRF